MFELLEKDVASTEIIMRFYRKTDLYFYIHIFPEIFYFFFPFSLGVTGWYYFYMGLNQDV